MPLTTDTVRAFMLDRAAQENIFSADLDFANEEIMTAMKMTAGAYNGMLPPSDNVTAAALPDIDEDDSFVHGVAASLMRSAMINIARNAIEYTAGGVVVSKDAQIMARYEKLEPILRAYFENGAKSRKTRINIAMCYGQIG